MAFEFPGFKMFLATCTGNAQNTLYRVPFEVSSTEDIAAACRKDHVCTEFKDGKRGSDNFVCAYAIQGDCDNDDTDDPAAWIVPDTVASRLPGVAFYAVKSRNCDKVKHPGETGEKSARPRWHYYFPLRVPVYDIAAVQNIMSKLLVVFPEFDRAGMKPAQFFFGHQDPVAEYHEGTEDISDFFKGHPQIDNTSTQRTDHTSMEKAYKATLASDKDDLLRNNLPDILKYFDSDNYDDWVFVGITLKSAENNYFHEWDDWSKTSAKYPGEDETWEKWDHDFKADGKTGPGSLFYEAKKRGWVQQYFTRCHAVDWDDYITSDEPCEDTETVDPETGEITIHIANPAAAAPAEKKRTSKKKEKKKYSDLVRDLIETAKIRQFGKALYRIVDGKYYKLLTDIFIDHELINKRGMEPEKQKAAQTMIRAFQREEDIEYDSYYVGFKNGIMNWKTLEFLPYENTDVPIFRYFDVNYNQAADTSFVDGVITDWCQGDDSKKQMLYELAGCCFYSYLPIKKWWSIEGKADTGKTTFLDLLRSIIGTDDIGNTPIQNLKDSNAIAELIDKPVNIVDDGSSKFATDLSYLRRIIQGDKIQVKLLYQNRFSVRLESRMIFVFNRIPRFRDDNDATAKKMLMIGFNRVYSNEEKDIRLIDKLTTEENKEAFLKLAIDGMMRVLSRNLTFTVSDESRRVVEQIMVESDQFISFVADTITDDYDWKMFLDGKRTKDVYDDFWQWAKAEGYQNILVRKQFTERCCKESGAVVRRSHGNSFYSFWSQSGT